MPSQGTKNEPIAVIGSGCRFPGSASNPSKLWNLLSQPRDVLSEIPSSRFNPHGFHNTVGETGGHSNVLHSYVLEEDIRVWDADFFNISANEAAAIDPQQRLLLETVYEALEAGGQRISDLRGSDTAVYVGLMGEEYSSIQGRELDMMPTYHATGTARSIVSNRISYFFDWHGASMTIDTACSSSLVAVHQGVHAIRAGLSRVAVAAGANLLLGPEPYLSESTLHMLSPRGRSHMWDVGADGYGRGDGFAAVVLKKLSDAIADGDAIECVIRETGVNQDGRTNGITVPSPDAQVALIEDTYRRAGLNLDLPEDRPQFFEAHGTGTSAGDPLEAEAIHRAIGKRLGPQDKLYVGSIKTVIGHTEGTAGIAGLMKASLALQNRMIPPNLLFTQLNPAIKPFYRGLEIPVRAVEWPIGTILRASVNSFGFGGTNAHAIIERYEPPAVTQTQTSDAAGLKPFTFSAGTKSSLKQMLRKTTAYLEKWPDVSLRDLAYTLNSRRSTFTYRIAFSARSADELRRKIQETVDSTELDNRIVVQPANRATRILGVFTGQGAQWPGMGKQLLHELPYAQVRIAELEMALATLPVGDRPSWSLRAELEAESSKSKLHLAEYAQPLCTALQILLVDLMTAANIKFDAVVGHSSGEIGAAYAAGVLSARDAIVVAYYRGIHTKLSQGSNGEVGAMLAVGTSPEDAESFVDLPHFEGRLCVAACNSPTSVTLSGDADAIEEAQAVFEDEKKFARTLRVDKAYHSHHMHPCTNPYVASLRKAGVQARMPRNGCVWYSSVHNGAINTGDPGEELEGMYWARNMTQTVLFSAAVEQAFMAEQSTMAIEVGPHGTLKGPALDTMKAHGGSLPSYISVLARNTNSNETFHDALGQIWTNALEGSIDLDKYQITAYRVSGAQQSLVKDFPRYSWDNKRVFWNESRRSRAFRTRSEPGHPLLGILNPESNDTEISWHNVIRPSNLPWLNGHQLQGQTVFPAAGYVALAAEAAKHVAKQAALPLHVIELYDLTIGKAIAFENDKTGVELLFSIHVDSTTELDGQRTVEIGFFARSVVGESTDAVVNASGRMRLSLGLEDSLVSPGAFPAQEVGQASLTEVDDEFFYTELRNLGYQYSGAFRALHSISRKLDHGRGRISKLSGSEMHRSERDLLVHPGYLDAAFQALFLAYSYPGDGRIWSLHVPVSIERIRIDAAKCSANTDSYLSFDSTIVPSGGLSSKLGLAGDVDIFSGDGDTGLIQVENIRLIPFAPASESQDTQMFYVNKWGVASPDADLATEDEKATPQDTELASLLERMSHYYLRCLVEEISSEEAAQASWQHRKLLDFARESATLLKAGRSKYGKREWHRDTLELLTPLIRPFLDQVDVRLLQTVGEHLVEAVRGKVDLSAVAANDDLLKHWYEESLGLPENIQYLARVVGQIAHVNPHMRILELGGGPGMTTLQTLRQTGSAFSHYTFTDDSPEALENVKSLLDYNGRISFQLLSLDTDFVQQGFQENSYDLVIGTLASQTAHELDSFLRSVRELLKPGGHAVLLEVTSGECVRLPLLMGGLQRWWSPAASGRDSKGFSSTAEWHSLLLQSGFSGIETITPSLNILSRPYSVIVSRATDDRINMLLEPTAKNWAAAHINALIIVSGLSLVSIRLAETICRLLRSYCDRIVVVSKADDLTSLRVGTKPTVLYLADLDEPVFTKYTPEAHKGLQKLWTTSQNVLWITRGARRDNPHAIMSLGLGRAMMVEHSHSKINVQFIDFALKARLDAHSLVDELLRLQIIGHLGRERSDFVWVQEPELEIDEAGRKWVPRIIPHGGFNDGYNASRRPIMATVDPSQQVVEIQSDGKALSLVKIHVPEVHHTDEEELVIVRVLYSSTTALRTSSLSQASYACIGIDSATNETVVALSGRIASIIEVPKAVVIPYHHDLAEAPHRLGAIAAYLLASLICGEATAGLTTLLFEPSVLLSNCVAKLAREKQVKILSVTASQTTESQMVFIHPHAGTRALRRVLPPKVAGLIDFSRSSSHGALLARLKSYAPEGAFVQSGDSFQARSLSYTGLVSLYKQTVDSDPENHLEVHSVSVDTYVNNPHSGAFIIYWTSKRSLSVPVRPSDAIPVLRSDRTYLLFGLAGAGGLGLPLAEYMVTLGARNIVLTSRKPSVDEDLMAIYAARGIRIEGMANDITDQTQVESLVAKIRLSWPPIGGVANGANVLNDMAFEDMTFYDMEKVLTPKVEGTRILDQIFYDDPLEFFIGFSSISIVLGRSGQSNYDTANIYMLGLASRRRARGLNASVIDIGPITGVGLMARDVSENVMNLLVSHGYRKMSGHDFLTTFTNGILTGRVNSGEPEELITGLTVHPKKGKFQPTWVDNPRFSHLLLNGDLPSGAVSDGSAQMESLEDFLKKSKTQGDVARVLRMAVLNKLQSILSLSDEIVNDPEPLLQQGTSALGLDSLLAVELRTWMLGELGVDMPVLKILSDTPIQGLVDFAVENLPAALTPNLDPKAKDAITEDSLRAPKIQEESQPAAAPTTPALASSTAPVLSPTVETAAKPTSASLRSVPSTATGTEVPTPTSASSASSDSDPSENSLITTKSSKLPLASSPQALLESPVIDTVLPMSFGQSRFWVMSQIVQDPCAFNISCDIEIASEVDIAALGRAVETVGHRHEALRTCFFNGDDHKPIQGILKKSPLRLETVTASSVDVDGLFQDIHRTKYNLSRGETMRAMLVSISRTRHHLLVGYHHINMDSSSFIVFMADLIKIYAGQKLPPPRVQYSGYATYQREQLQSGRWDSQINYWKQEFSRLPDPLPILCVSPNTSRPRTNLTDYENQSVETRVSARVARQVQATCRKFRVTPFHLYTTILQVTLARLAATDDICIGMADANRTDAGATDSMGNFLNLLPLRLRTNLTSSFSSLLTATKDKVLHALSNSAVPFDVIMEKIGVQRSATHSPLFQAFIDYRYVTEKLPFGQGYLEGKRYIVSKVPYDIMIEMIDTPTGEASLKLLVQDPLYTIEEAETILTCFTTLLDTFTRDGEKKAGEVQMFDAVQVEQALQLGKGEILELEHPSFLSEVDVTATSQPGSIALQDSLENTLSWSDMKAKSIAVGQSLRDLNLPAHSKIGVFQQPDVDWVCSMLGVWRAEHTYVPLETSQGIRRLADVAKEARLGALLMHDATMPLVDDLGLSSTVRVINVSTLTFGHLTNVSFTSNHRPDDEAMIVYTSGSTGVPKGISIAHRVVVNAARGFLHRWPLPPQTVLQQTALSFDVSWWGVVIGLATKGTVVVAGAEARRDPGALTDLIVSKKVTFTFAVPSESVAWLQGGDSAALHSSDWAYHCSGGEPYSLNLIKHLKMLDKPGLRAINIYGPTETMIPNAHEVMYRTSSEPDMPVPIGRVMPNYTARVVDLQGHPVPAGIPGQLLFAGAGIASSYVDNPALTSERFPADDLAPSGFTERGWNLVHHSGDQGYLRASDGAFILQGRINGDTQVKLRGLRIDMLDVEAQILATAKRQISDAVAHVHKPELNNSSTEFLVAHVVLTKEAKSRYTTAAEQKEFLAQIVKELRVPDYMRPAVMAPMEFLPLTHHGKVDRKAIARLPLADTVPKPTGKTSEVVESLENNESLVKMKDLWLSILGESVHAHTLAPESDFFLVGGNSLLLIRVQGDLRKRYGINLPLTKLFQLNTLAHMASLLDGKDSTASAEGEIDWSSEIKLQPNVAQLRATGLAQPRSGLVIALTGASGFLGLELVRQLVQLPEVKTVHALAVRNQKKLAQIWSPKLVIHAGDLSQPQMGMADSTIAQIFKSSHAVIHNGADVSFLKAYASVRSTNLESTKDILRLSLQFGHVRHLHYVSTAGIATMLSHDLYEESLASFPPARSPEGYVLSKWASELYLERANAATGLPITIHRPTAIVGENAPHLDVMSNILHYSRKMETVPSMSALGGSFQFVPVEEVARGILSSVLTVNKQATVQYRNHSGHPKDTVDVHGLAPYLSKQMGIKVTVTPDAKWIRQAEASGMADEVVSYMEGVNLSDRKGEKWNFPRALNGSRSS